jgi:hypothetical protein
MTLFFDTKVQFPDTDTISTIITFHPAEPLFAIAGFGENRGGSVTLFDDSVKYGRKKSIEKIILIVKLTGRAFERHYIPKSSR